MKALLPRIGPVTGYLGAVALFGALSYWVVYRDLNTVVQGLLAVAAIGLGVWVWTARHTVLSALISRQARRGSNSIVMVIAFVGIVGLLNFLAAQHPQRWDLTETGTYSLSPQTLQLLASLEEPVRVIGFYQEGDWRRGQADDLLREYATRSNQISYEFIDPVQRPGTAQQYQVRDFGMLFLQGDRRQEVFGTTESDFTNALLKLTSTEPKKVAFLIGHGERPLSEPGNHSYGAAVRALEADNYTVTPVNLAIEAIPEDVEAIIIAGPTAPLLERDQQILKEYLRAGGKMMILYDPGPSFGLEALVEDYGVTLGRDLVLDPERAFYGDQAAPVILEYGWNPITKDLPQTVLPHATYISPPEVAQEGVVVERLAVTSNRGWAETDLSQPRFDEGVDPQGPLALAVSIEAEVATAEGAPAGQDEPDQGADRSRPRTRVVVFGDSDFASDGFIGMGGNRDLFVNSVNWLTESEELISIRPKPPEDRGMYLTATQTNLILFSTVVLLPLVVLLAGGSVWWSRR